MTDVQTHPATCVRDHDWEPFYDGPYEIGAECLRCGEVVSIYDEEPR